jgi:hypothetical protein
VGGWAEIYMLCVSGSKATNPFCGSSPGMREGNID